MMFYSKVLLLGFAFYLLLDEVSAFLLPDRVRHKRDHSQLDLKVPLHQSELSDQVDRYPGDSQHSSFSAPLDHLAVHHYNTPSRRKPKDKKKRVSVPVDIIGGSLLSNLRSIKDEPEEYWEYYTE